MARKARRRTSETQKPLDLSTKLWLASLVGLGFVCIGFGVKYYVEYPKLDAGTIMFLAAGIFSIAYAVYYYKHRKGMTDATTDEVTDASIAGATVLGLVSS